MSKKKSKSRKRFEQLNALVDVIAPTLHGPSQLAVMMVCYRHAGVRGEFRVSCRRIAKSTSLSVRQVMRLLAQLTQLGVIERLCDHQGPIPAKYRITGKAANHGTAEMIRS